MPGRKTHVFFPVCIWWYYLVLLTTLFFLPHGHADDAAIMQELAKSLNMAGWSGNNPCKWSGVECDNSGRVTDINLSGKSVSGKLPPDLNQLSSLQSLNLQRNQISGPLPSLSNLSSLKEVYLDSNNFTSIPKDFMLGLTGLQEFSMSDNVNLPPWTIPNALTDSTQLTSFTATRANIIGPIPDIFESFPSLQNLTLSYNKITGSLPPSFAKSGIQKLLLNNQQMSGRIDVIGSMSQANLVWIHVNDFSGPIPDLSGCKQLYEIQLRDNSLTGVIPASLTSLPDLKNVSLQNNNFQGPMPDFPKGVQVSLGNSVGDFCHPSPGPCDPQVTILLQVASELGYPEVLAQSWNGNNACNNWEFVTCASGKVTVINLARQNFSGAISPAIANLTSLSNLDFSNNHLTGPIPSSLTSLPNLKLVDVTNNNISGKVPPFSPGVTVKYAGNPFIGIDLPPSSPPGDVTKGSTSSSTNERKTSAYQWVIAIIVIALLVIGVVVAFIFYRSYVKKQGKWGKGREKRRQPHVEASTSGAPSQSDTQSSEGFSGGIRIPIDLLREVTDNFSEQNILGEGGFGIVYGAQLPDGTRIAVKRMGASTISKKGRDEFKAEIDVLSKVKHRNLVSLVGFCVNGNERLLVYEYMAQGTLGEHLHCWKQRGLTPLSWKLRLSIALDVARGVQYLHDLTEEGFIHRDLKPSNILLGDDMRAKVSDFGLVKNAPDGNFSVQTRLAGTFGYLAPEYVVTGRVTNKVDVYSFGVILMELITGQKALDSAQPDERSHLVTWFRKIIVSKEEIRTSVDPTLEQDDETFESICKVAELAASCTAREPHQRPVMGYVLSALSPLVVKDWIPAAAAQEESFSIDLSESLPDALQRWKAGEGKTMSTSSFLFGDNNDDTEFNRTRGMPSKHE